MITIHVAPQSAVSSGTYVVGGQQRLVARNDLADLVKVAGRLEHLVHVVVVLLVSLNVPDQLRLVRQQLLRLRRQSEFIYRVSQSSD